MMEKEHKQFNQSGIFYTCPDTTGKRQAEGGLRLKAATVKKDSSQPLVSIVTVSFNASKTLEKTIRSVVSQSYRNLEYIIVDGASTDETVDIIKRYESQIDYYVSEPDFGIYHAMNKGISLAQGNYICLLNADDQYKPEFVERSLQLAAKTNADIVYSQVSMSGEIKPSIPINDAVFIHHLFINHSSFLVSRETYNSVGLYDETYRIVGDAKWIRKSYLENKRFERLPECHFEFQEGGLSSGSSAEKRKLFVKEAGKCLREFFPFMEEEDAENLYLSRFNLKYIGDLIQIYDRYCADMVFRKAFRSYFRFLLQRIVVFQENDVTTFVPQYLVLAKQLSLPYSLFRIVSTQTDVVGTFEKIEEIASDLRGNASKSLLIHFVSVFSSPSETFIYDLIDSLERGERYKNVVLCDERVLEGERFMENCLVIPWEKEEKVVREMLYEYLFAQIPPQAIVGHFALNGWKIFRRLDQLDFDFPSVYMTHGIDVFAMEWNLPYRQFMRNVAGLHPQILFTTVSEYLLRALVEQGISRDKITTVHNAANERFFQFRKKSFFQDGNTLKLLAVGRLVSWKGHRYLIEGLSYFVQNFYDNVSLTIVYGKIDDELANLRKQIAELGLIKKIEFVPFVDFNEEPDYYARHDIFILPSTYSEKPSKRSETFGISTLEAILSGLPVIVTDAGGAQEVVGSENVYAKIVPHNDGPSIGKALGQFYTEKKGFSDNHEYATNRLKRFSRDKQLQLLDAVINLSSKKTIRPALFSYADFGGAGYAALRLHKSLLNEGLDATLYLGTSQSKTVRTKVIGDSTSQAQREAVVRCIRRRKGNSILSCGLIFQDWDELKKIEEKADIVNLHWVARLLSVEAVAWLSHQSTPLVLTIRDMNPLTGGCHSFHGCSKWMENCDDCPQLIENKFDLPAKILDCKKKYFNFSNITVVTLSQHSKKILEKSIFKNCRIEVIPNSIETDVFLPHDKTQARIELKLPLDKKILFYVPSARSAIKGANELKHAFQILQEKHSDLRPLLILAGRNSNFQNGISIPYVHFGYVESNEILSLLYSAADVTVVPSLEETFSNSTAESLSCGTPVVGFQTGAIHEMVKDYYTGLTVPVGDCEGFADSIYKVLTVNELSANCRRYAQENLRSGIQGIRYKTLFSDLIQHNQQNKKKNSSPCLFPETARITVELLLKSLKETTSEIDREKNLLKNELSKTRKNLNKVKHSLSWRLTLPFRGLKYLFLNPKLFIDLVQRWKSK